MPRKRIKYENLHRAITPKICQRELCFLSTALSFNEIYSPIKFQVDISNTYQVMVRTRIKYENLPRAITPKIYQKELWILGTALPFHEIYSPMKFQVDISNTFGVMPQTRIQCKGQLL